MPGGSLGALDLLEPCGFLSCLRSPGVYILLIEASPPNGKSIFAEEPGSQHLYSKGTKAFIAAFIPLTALQASPQGLGKVSGS